MLNLMQRVYLLRRSHTERIKQFGRHAISLVTPSQAANLTKIFASPEQHQRHLLSHFLFWVLPARVAPKITKNVGCHQCCQQGEIHWISLALKISSRQLHGIVQSCDIKRRRNRAGLIKR